MYFPHMGRAGAKNVSLPTKLAIISDYMTTPRTGIIAKKYGLNQATICRIIKTMKDSPVKPNIVANVKDWKAKATEACQDTFLAAVSDRTDIYKAGGLARDGLKGLGVFAPDNAVTIQQLVAGVPTDWRDRYVGKGQGDDTTAPGSGIDTVTSEVAILASDGQVVASGVTGK